MKIACTLNWIKDAVTINKTFNDANDKYQLEVSNISDKAAQAVTNEFGIKVNSTDAKGKYFKAKSKYPFKFFDDAGNEIDPQKIGNGSKAIVNVTGSYNHKFEKQYGKGPIVDSTVVVKELVAYEGTGGDDSEEAL